MVCSSDRNRWACFAIDTAHHLVRGAPASTAAGTTTAMTLRGCSAIVRYGLPSGLGMPVYGCANLRNLGRVMSTLTLSTGPSAPPDKTSPSSHALCFESTGHARDIGPG